MELVIQKWNWDDRELIRAYDRAMRKKEKNENNSNGDGKSLAKKWEVGCNCRAKYSDDGLFYEAKITRVDGDFCSVQFWGYGDIEEVALKDLLESAGKRARRNQIKSYADDTIADMLQSSGEEMESEGNLSDNGDEMHDMPTYHVAPPHPPGVQVVPPVNEELSDISPILCSWYWAGYHSGMYAAQEGQRSRFHRRNHWHSARSSYNRRRENI